MTQKPIAVVVGVTGKQGTGIVKTLLAAGIFHFRAITRDVNSETTSKYLAALGAQLCEGSPSSREQLQRHFAGAQAVFGQTPHNVSEDFEIAAALAQAKAASTAGVRSFVFSSLENVNKRSEVASLPHPSRLFAAMRACTCTKIALCCLHGISWFHAGQVQCPILQR